MVAPLRAVFFGTPAFAVPTLTALIESPHLIVGVVTQLDRPRDRGLSVQPPVVKTLALAHALPVWQPATLKDEAFVDVLRDLSPDLGVVAAYGKLIPDSVLAVPRLGMINVHASLLPRYRGASPIQRAIAAGDTETGITIIRLVKALDAGPMLAQERVPIGADATSGDVEATLATLGAQLLVRTVDCLAAGPISETVQDEALATYAPRLTKSEGLIDWTRPADAVHNHVRAMQPWPGAFSYLHGTRIVIRRSAVARGSDRPPGTVVEVTGDRLRVATGGGTSVRVLELQPEGRRAMDVRDFLAGHRLEVGVRFTVSAAP